MAGKKTTPRIDVDIDAIIAACKKAVAENHPESDKIKLQLLELEGLR